MSARHRSRSPLRDHPWRGPRPRPRGVATAPGWGRPSVAGVFLILLSGLAGCLTKFPALSTHQGFDPTLVSAENADSARRLGPVKFAPAGSVDGMQMWLAEQPDGDWMTTGHWADASRSFVFNWQGPGHYLRLVPVAGYGGWRVMQRAGGLETELATFTATTVTEADRVIVVRDGRMTIGFGRDRAVVTCPDAPEDAKFGLAGPALDPGDAFDLFDLPE